MGKVVRDAAYYAELAKATEQYQPCHCGVHICGIAPNDEGFVTIANIPARNAREARQIWLACRSEAEAGPEDGRDFVVDLNLSWSNSHVEDFWLSRQMLDRCLSAGRALFGDDRSAACSFDETSSSAKPSAVDRDR